MIEFFFVRQTSDYVYNRNLRSLKPEAKLILVDRIAEVEEDYFPLFTPFSRLMRRFFTRLNLKNQFLYRIVIRRFEQRYSQLLTGESVTFYFDHTSDDFTRSVVQYFRTKYGVRMIALPHANHILQNKIFDKGMTKPIEKKDFRFFDRVICSSVNQADLFLGSMLVLEDYAKFAMRKSEASLVRDKDILILHSKFIGNVNDSEFFRMLDMLNDVDSLARVVLKPHPRSSRQELQLLKRNVLSIEISNEETDGLLRSSRFVFIIQTSVIIDALEYGCQVVILKYMTTNTLDPALMNFCIVLNSPDDLYKFLHRDSLGLNFEPRRLYEPMGNIGCDKILEEINRC